VDVMGSSCDPGHVVLRSKLAGGLDKKNSQFCFCGVVT